MSWEYFIHLYSSQQKKGLSLAKEVNSNHIGCQKQKNESKSYCSNQQLIH